MLEITNYKTVKDDDLVARMDVTIVTWGLTIRGIEEHNDGYERWFNYPYFYLDPDLDEGCTRPCLLLQPMENNKKFFDAVQREVDKMRENIQEK